MDEKMGVNNLIERAKAAMVILTIAGGALVWMLADYGWRVATSPVGLLLE